ncbi:E3 ubiquitin-protein ligase TRIM37-like [Malaya genurostris]|uniref:E3 ubiquitin-protein ligase TRIM37-like n=1 Tax=Malaya genurostris TaxID=325434 RepID=UPI0026F3FE9B|nr:E3 ubiquitin-protein ligase TRIM37-like [Malaya genurostris]
MSGEKINKSALFWPAEISLDNSSCAVCTEDANKPVFCTTCAKMLCFNCMARCQQDNGCGFCRSKTPIEEYRKQCHDYCCDKHELLVTLFCTECEICVCKQCLNKEAEHALHSITTIDGIRMELARKIKTLYSFLRLTEAVNELTDSAIEFVECFVPPVMRDKLKLMHETIQSLVIETETYNLKELVNNRTQLKNRLVDMMESITKLKKQDLSSNSSYQIFLFKIDLTMIFSYDTDLFPDKYGNVWKVTVYPRYGKIWNLSKFAAFQIKLVSGDPGRYEMNITSSESIIPFHRILDFMCIPSASAIFKIWESDSKTSKLRELVLTLSVRRVSCQCGNFNNQNC